MKKFLSKIMFAAVAVLSVAGFTSCNNADDDPYLPTVPSSGSTEFHQQTPSKPIDTTPAYGAVLSENILDMYDINVVLHSADKTMEVALTKANGEAMVTRTSNNDVTYYQYLFTEIEGQQGIGNVEVKVTPKADIKTTIAGMPANEKFTVMQGGKLFKAMKGTDGKPVVNKVITHIAMQINSIYPEELLEDKGNGTFGYDVEAEVLQNCMSQY